MRSLCLVATVFSVLVLAACADDGAPAPADDVRDRRDAARDAAAPDASAPDVEEDVTIDLGQPDLGQDADASGAADGSGDAGAGDAYAQRVGPEGARVSWEQVELLIPAGTFDEPVDIRISIADDINAPPNVVPLTSIYRFEPAGLSFPRGIGVTFRLERDEREGLVFWTDPGTTAFSGLVTSYLEDARITSTIFHFSYGFGGIYDDTTCDGEPVNLCGGCSTLEGAPSDPCGDGGRLQCTDDGEALTCEGEAVCGDGVISGSEDCDGEALGGLTCADFAAFEEGDLRCDTACRYIFDACIGPDPCEGVVCDRPPAPTCDGDDVVSYAATGVCVLGECEHEEAGREPCGALTCRDGVCVAIPGPGDIAINEFLADGGGSPDGDFEWVELFNTTDLAFDLNGFTIRDDDVDEHGIERSLTLPPSGFLVLAGSANAVPGEVDYVWDGFTLANSGDEVVLEDPDGNILAAVRYGSGWPTTSGVSAQLGPENLGGDRESAESWCAATSSFGEWFGTPGAANDRCDVGPDPCADVVCEEPPAASCEGDIARSFDPAGTCAGGECSYAARETDCAERGGCIGGRCADVACEEITCPPRAPLCEGDAVVTYGPGVCDGGECLYDASAPEPCPERCRDGVCVGPSTGPGPGDLVITEFMANTEGADDGLEWLELHNATGGDLSLDGAELRDDDTNVLPLPDGLVVPAGGYVVLAETEGAVPGAVLYTWNPEVVSNDAFTLANTADELILVIGEVEIDRVVYTSGVRSGASRQLDPDEISGDNSDASTGWCNTPTDAAFLYDGVNAGTPGAVNVDC